jgi:ApaG protein
MSDEPRKASRSPQETPGLHATVDRVTYAEELEGLPDRPHSFLYDITIRNDSSIPVTVVGRKWVVREQNGSTVAVEGDGVVGQFPLLAPGETFSYRSRHLIAGPTAVAEGSYLARDPEDRRLLIRIPAFEMRLPEAGDDG